MNLDFCHACDELWEMVICGEIDLETYTNAIVMLLYYFMESENA